MLDLFKSSSVLLVVSVAVPVVMPAVVAAGPVVGGAVALLSAELWREASVCEKNGVFRLCMSLLACSRK